MCKKQKNILINSQVNCNTVSHRRQCGDSAQTLRLQISLLSRCRHRLPTHAQSSSATDHVQINGVNKMVTTAFRCCVERTKTRSPTDLANKKTKKISRKPRKNLNRHALSNSLASKPTECSPLSLHKRPRIATPERGVSFHQKSKVPGVSL